MESSQNNIVDQFKSDLQQLMIRYTIFMIVKDYNPKETYIIYDNNDIQVFNQEIFDLKTAFKQYKQYTISKPVENEQPQLQTLPRRHKKKRKEIKADRYIPYFVSGSK